MIAIAPRASLRARLTAWYGVVLLVTLLTLGLALHWLVAGAILGRVDAMLEFEFRETAELLGRQTTGVDLGEQPETFLQSYLIRVLDGSGRVLAQSQGLQGLPWPGQDVLSESSFVNIRLGDLGPFRLLTDRVPGPGPTRWVQIATSLQSAERDLSDFRRALFTILPAGLIFTTLGGYWLAGRSLRPVARMTEAARRISAENLSERLAVDNPDDELGRLATTLNAMLDRIDRSFDAMRRFTADAAHELRTPVAAARTEAEVALLGVRSEKEYQDVLKSIVEESGRLSTLLDRLLLLSREDAGVVLSKGRFRLDELLEGAVAGILDAAARAGVSVHVGALPELEIEGDPLLLRKVFDNLLENAVKYNMPGGTVGIRAGVEREYVLIEVSDTGVGIAGEALPRVFDRFFRADASRSRRTGGTGLGLSIARAVVERHGGTIAAESTPGVGSKFRVALRLQLD